MKVTAFASVATLLAGLTAAHPIKERQVGLSLTDINILQFALTLEHLENAFYQQGLRTFSQQHFLQAGFSQDFFLNMLFIASDEATHVQTLQQALIGAGVRPVQPCHYNFPVTDVQSFVTLSAILESVGTSAYLGAAPFVESKDILGVAGSILGVEAFHTSMQRISLGAIGAPDPFTTPLGANAVFTLAAQFIVACPADNPPLPFTAFPGLVVAGSGTCLRENIFAGQPGLYTPSNTPPPPPPPPAAAVSNGSDLAAVSSTTTDAAAAATSTTTTADSAAASSTTTTDAAAAIATLPPLAAAASESISAVIETTSAADAAAAAATSAPAAAKRDVAVVAVSSNVISCQAPFPGSPLQLVPSFQASRVNLVGVVQVFVTFVSGLNVVSVGTALQIGSALTVIIPPGISGQTFVFVTVNSITGGKLSDTDILFGPAIFEVAPQFPTIQL